MLPISGSPWTLLAPSKLLGPGKPLRAHSRTRLGECRLLAPALSPATHTGSLQGCPQSCLGLLGSLGCHEKCPLNSRLPAPQPLPSALPPPHLSVCLLLTCCLFHPSPQDL